MENFYEKYKQNKIFPLGVYAMKSDIRVNTQEREGWAPGLAICGWFTADTFNLRFYVMLACWFHLGKLVTLAR